MKSDMRLESCFKSPEGSIAFVNVYVPNQSDSSDEKNAFHEQFTVVMKVGFAQNDLFEWLQQPHWL